MKNYPNEMFMNPNMYGAQTGAQQGIMVPHGPHGPGCTCGQQQLAPMGGPGMMGNLDPQDPDVGPMMGGFQPQGTGAGSMMGGFGPQTPGAGPMMGGFGPQTPGAGPMMGGFGPQGPAMPGMMVPQGYGMTPNMREPHGPHGPGCTCGQ
ncbi:hypothetical protein E1I69_08215 [Bacillus timonensis]|uniref:Uncharacterized protein n=1 Tax=Bacillus timonensis TaxID=1033734 RepID=A0A4S3PU83_9BACI|nr:hypothetical protein [Bacillus timonensis]THE13319.1 hypothetical protein E1I69_08215 [Bacillus timonensis]